MRRNTMKKALSFLLVLSLAVGMTACAKNNSGGEGNKTDTQDNAISSTDTPLVVGYNGFSEKFSPFFYETSYDADVVRMTQVNLLTSDRTGEIVYDSINGETIPYNGSNYTYEGISDIEVNYDEESDITSYTIKLRDDVLFSDGEELTIDDLIFTYYVLADPSYDGNQTFFSTPIIGLINYRKNNTEAENTNISTEEIEKELSEPGESTITGINESIIAPTLTDELEWVKGVYEDEAYASYTEEYPVAKDLFAYFYSLDDKYDSSAREEADVLKDIIVQYNGNYKALGEAYAGDENYFLDEAQAIANESVLNNKLASGGEEVPNIEGIKKVSDYELVVQTNGFDATAILKICDVFIAPLHYYGNEDMYDYQSSQFGFTRGDLSGVKSKTTVPMGAGPYKFVKYDNKIVSFEANENYYKGIPVTTNVQFKETQESDKISGVGTGTIDISYPSGSVAGFEEIASYNSNGEITGDVITTNTVDHMGYGYIGMNAKTMSVNGEPSSEASKNLRKAFATVFSVYRDVTIDSYYGDFASVINYTVSNTSWAAPQKSDEGYQVAYSIDVNGNPIYTGDMTAEEKYQAALKAAIEYFVASGYTYDETKEQLTKAPEGAKLEYEVIIPAGGSGDHPTFALLTKAKEVLAGIGMTLTIHDPSDSNVLWNKIDEGSQEIWVAAWSASVDPDLYQVYYSENSIGLGGTESNYFAVTDKELNQLIMEARTSSDTSYRKVIYKTCYDIILDWAVEVPVYQRQNCVIVSTERINPDTITSDNTAYWDWMNEVEKIEKK